MHNVTALHQCASPASGLLRVALTHGVFGACACAGRRLHRQGVLRRAVREARHVGRQRHHQLTLAEGALPAAARSPARGQDLTDDVAPAAQDTQVVLTAWVARCREKLAEFRKADKQSEKSRTGACAPLSA